MKAPANRRFSLTASDFHQTLVAVDLDDLAGTDGETAGKSK
jgi:hypothetical protein